MREKTAAGPRPVSFHRGVNLKDPVNRSCFFFRIKSVFPLFFLHVSYRELHNGCSVTCLVSVSLIVVNYCPSNSN